MVKHLAYLLTRIGVLFQIPNFTAQNAVFLAEWTLDNYGCEELSTIESMLMNPPRMKEKTWRLTPDTITEWMRVKLEDVAAAREGELAKLKEGHKEPLPNVDYKAFSERLAKEGIPSEKRYKGWEDPEYLAYKAEFERKRVLTQGKSQFTEDMLTPKEPESVTEPLEAKSRRV